MRIAYVTFEYPPFVLGGAGIHAAHATRELAACGHEVEVFTPALPAIPAGAGEAAPEMPGGPVIRRVPVSPRLPFRALQFWLALPDAIHRAGQSSRFDIVCINGLSYGFFRTRLCDAPHVLTVHHPVGDALASHRPSVLSRLLATSGEHGYLMPLIEKRAVFAADRIIAVSGYTRDRLRELYGIPAAGIDVIHNGIDPAVPVFTDKELSEVRARYGIPGGPVVLFVGRTDDPRKGLDVLVRAVARVPEAAGAVLVIAGRGGGDEALRLARASPGRIIFTGYVDDQILGALYQLCTVYASPSRLEGFGLTILEACRAGKRVVATRAGAVPELFGDRPNVRLADVDDTGSIFESLIWSIKNPLLPAAFYEENTAWIQERFGWNRCARMIEKSFLQCLTHHGPE
jgi:glycosyltransferase involved in cell wall biosynthesis